MEPIVVGGYLLLMNIVGLYVMYSDKRRAIKHRFRIPERMLFIVSLLGGSIGTWAGMYLFRFQNGGGIQLKEHRLFETEEDAKASIPYKPEPKRSRTPYDYM